MGSLEKRVEGYYKKQKKKAGKKLERIHENATEDNIRELRVSLKKIRALFRLTEALGMNGFDAGRRFKRMKHLLKISGAVREWQVMLNVLSKYEKQSGRHYSGLKNYLKGQETVSHIRMIEEAARWEKKSLKQAGQKVKKVLAERNEELLQQRLKAYCHRLISELRAIQTAPAGERPLHLYRTRLKDLLFTLQISGRSTDIGEPQIHALKTLQQDLGNWHDSFIFLNQIYNYRESPQGNHNGKKPSYNELLKYAKKDQRSLVQNVLEKIMFVHEKDMFRGL